MQTATIEPTSPLGSFRAYVDDSLITSATSFFDNKITSIIRELLQNSRRSGATRVDLIKQGSRWTYSDNGPGCFPYDLLGLGASRWQGGVKEREAPAGCGFFSLARRNPIVRCPKNAWGMDLSENHFNGQAEIQPYAAVFDEADREKGLIIEFDYSDGSFYGIENLARYMPLDFYVNGARQRCHEKFMTAPAGSVAHKLIEFSEFIKIRVDLVKGTNSSQTACYHGFTIQFAEYNYLRFGCIGADHYSVQAAIEVSRERALPLELPQRNSMVKSETTSAIKDAIQFAGLELAAEHLAEICIAAPSVWLSERSKGYTGPVLYTKFIGTQISRHGCSEMAEYTMEVDDNHEVFDTGEYITFETFEEEGMRIAPDNDLLSFIAQSTIPSKPIEGAAGVAYDMDVDAEFAPGLKLVDTLKSLQSLYITEGAEGYDWYLRLKTLLSKGSAWFEECRITGSGTTKEGKTFTIDEDLTRGGDDDNLYDTLQLEFRSEDGSEEFIFPTEALFDITGDKSDESVNFTITKGWFERMPSSFPDTLALSTFKFRKCSEADSDEDVSVEKIAENLQKGFARFSGLADFYKERFIAAAIAAVEDGIYHIEEKPERIVIDLALRPGSRSVYCSPQSTCRFVMPFEVAYTFEGSHGTVCCDAQGLRDPNEKPDQETKEVVYPEFHSFDVESMRQLGLNPGHHDILEACGWHDSTKRIYLTPAPAHLMWRLGYLDVPYLENDNRRLTCALREAHAAGKLSEVLIAALWKLDKELLSEFHQSTLPPSKKIWIYEEA